MNRTSRPSRRLAHATLGLTLCVGLGAGAVPTAAVARPSAEPAWGPVQEVPPFYMPHEQPVTAVFPDGTLVAVWIDDDPRREDPPGAVLRSVRPPGGIWRDPVTFPIADIGSVDAIAPRLDGDLEIATTSRPGGVHQVRTWNADGSIDAAALANRSDSYQLAGDLDGDVVATRLGRYDEKHGFDRAVTYLASDASTWRRLPSVGADPRDVFVAGTGDSVWMAGYDQEKTVLRVRRWSPGMSSWKVEWSRHYPAGHQRKPLVDGLDFAVTDGGRATLAFREREVGSTGDTIRAVRREGRSGWTRPAVLQRLAAGHHRIATGPVVAAVGDVAEVAWTVPGKRSGWREVRLARLGGDGPDVRRVGTTFSFDGFRDLSLDVDVRADGDVLVTYLRRKGSQRQVYGWFGPHEALIGTKLLKSTNVQRHDSAFLVPGLAAVIARNFNLPLASRVLED